MLGREARRLRRTFRRIMLLCAAVPLGGCTSKGADTPGDASVDTDGAVDASFPTDAPTDVPSFPILDTSYDWCEAGPPVLMDASACDNFYRVPCGIPPTGNICVYVCAGMGAVGCVVSDGAAPPPPDASDEAGNDGGAPADAAATPPVYVECQICAAGRRPEGLRRATFAAAKSPVGDYFARMAYLEAASVDAFRTLRDELRVAGAPRSLVRAAERASSDEAAHAAMTSELASRHGGTPPVPETSRPARRSLEEMAVENAVEGCVRETYGALVATWQARHACDAGVKAIMKRIAADETRHAALAWATARWVMGQLDGAARGRVEAARREAVRALRSEIETDVHPDLVATAGLPPARVAVQLLDAMESAAS